MGGLAEIFADFQRDVEHKERYADFAGGIGAAAPADHWYKLLLRNAKKEASRISLFEGRSLRDSAPPLSRAVLAKVARVLYLCGDAEAATRRFLLALDFHAMGRCGELALTTYNCTRWDYELRCLAFDWSSVKTVKQKHLAVLPEGGGRWELDVYLAMADWHLLGGHQQAPLPAERDGAGELVLPFFGLLRARGEGAAAPLVTSALQRHVAGAAGSAGAALAVPELHPATSSKSLRAGALVTAAAARLNASVIAQRSGHGGGGPAAAGARESAMNAYFGGGSAVATVLAGLPLAGWPVPPFSDHGLCPAAARLLEPLAALPAPPAAALLEGLVDGALQLGAARTPLHMRGQRLRPLAHALLATLLMHFSERRGDGRHAAVAAFVQRGLEAGVAPTRDAVAAQYALWGSAVLADFTRENLRVTTAGPTSSAMEALTAAVGASSDALAARHASLAAASARGFSDAAGELSAVAAACARLALLVEQQGGAIERLALQLEGARLAVGGGGAGAGAMERARGGFGSAAAPAPAAPASAGGAAASSTSAGPAPAAFSPKELVPLSGCDFTQAAARALAAVARGGSFAAVTRSYRGGAARRESPQASRKVAYLVRCLQANATPAELQQLAGCTASDDALALLSRGSPSLRERFLQRLAAAEGEVGIEVAAVVKPSGKRGRASELRMLSVQSFDARLTALRRARAAAGVAGEVDFARAAAGGGDGGGRGGGGGGGGSGGAAAASAFAGGLWAAEDMGGLWEDGASEDGAEEEGAGEDSEDGKADGARGAGLMGFFGFA